MAESDRARRVLFLGGLAVLVGWAAVMAVLGPGAGHGGGQAGGGARGEGARALPAGRARTPGGSGDSVAARSAVEFLRAYLGYEVGAAPPAERARMARLATPRFGAELARERVGAPSGAPAREWVSRVQRVRVGVFAGEPALLVSVFVVGPAGGHLITPTLVERGSRWLIAGLGE